MISSFDISGMLAIDAQSVDRLRLQAKQDPEQALRGAARQFEALFMNMLLKTMREATPRDGMFDSEQTRFYTSMLDQQLAQNLSAKGIGLADIMIRQLSRSVVPNAQQPSAPAAAFPSSPTLLPKGEGSGLLPSPSGRGTEGEGRFMGSGQAHVPVSMLKPQVAPNLSAQGIDNTIRKLARTVDPDAPQTPVPASAPAANPAPAPQSSAFMPPAARDFVNKVWNYAREASQAIGIPAHFVVAQAALESGWGKHEIRSADGNPSFNLFGIKAGRSWSGSVVEKATTEYVNGTPQKRVEKFRAYDSYAEAFRDYGNLLRGNPRYAAVLDQQDAAGFARGLQQAGYATDPRYADKLMRILQGRTLRQSLTT